MKKIAFLLVLLSIIISGWFIYTEIYSDVALDSEEYTFEVLPGENARTLGVRLEEEGIIRNATLFRYFVRFKNVDTLLQSGTFNVTEPITLERVVNALKAPIVEESEITILPGWDLADIASYFNDEGIATVEEVYAYTAEPAQMRGTPSSSVALFPGIEILTKKPVSAGLDGYLAPDTYRIYKNEDIKSILNRLLEHRDAEFTDEIYQAIEATEFTVHEVLTLASIVEREVRSKEDRKLVADIFLKRLNIDMALQADSTVHYAIQKKGDVFTTSVERDSDSPWNTYKFRGLPPGPIATPSFESIMAVLEPTPNDYYFFLTDMEGNVHYGKNLGEHNQNVQKYLR